MRYTCISNLIIIGSGNGLSPDRWQAIIWTSAGILLIGLLGTNFSKIFIEIHEFLFKKMHLKMSSGKWRPFCLTLYVLKNRFSWSSRYLNTANTCGHNTTDNPTDICLRLKSRKILLASNIYFNWQILLICLTVNNGMTAILCANFQLDLSTKKEARANESARFHCKTDLGMVIDSVMDIAVLLCKSLNALKLFRVKDIERKNTSSWLVDHLWGL